MFTAATKTRKRFNGTLTRGGVLHAGIVAAVVRVVVLARALRRHLVAVVLGQAQLRTLRIGANIGTCVRKSKLEPFPQRLWLSAETRMD